MELTKKERGQVKKTAQALLETLKGEKLVLDWRKKQQKCSAIYQHVFESYYGEDKSIYSVAA